MAEGRPKLSTSGINTPTFRDIVRPHLPAFPAISLMHFHLPHVQPFSNIVEQVRDVMKHYKHEKESEAHQV
jgi:hypothetical protein